MYVYVSMYMLYPYLYALMSEGPIRGRKPSRMNFNFHYSFFFLLILSHRALANNNGIYIVYTGSAASQTSNHDHLLSSFSTREENPVVHTYRNGFSGFSARLSDEEAESIARMPGVVSVFRDPILQLHTTRSWDFLHQTDVDFGIISRPSSNNSSSSSSSSQGVDTIIGVIDSGIWPESKAFDDEGMGPIPSRWKGTCMAGHAFHPSNCNRKLIGARYYASPESTRTSDHSPRDIDGHGTHVAAIAAGSPVVGASFNGLASGTAKGGSPGSRIAVYRVCNDYGCSGSDLLKAVDDAIADGVDMLSISIGNSLDEADFWTDPIAIGAFHAMERGVLVVCSAGNGGGDERNSVVNVAPWILTVAATTIDRDFEANVVFGGNRVIKGGAINVANLRKSPMYPLIYGASAMNNRSEFNGPARNCEPEYVDASKFKGKIAVCEYSDREEYSPDGKLEGIVNMGGVGMILISNDEKDVPSVHDFPMTAITWQDGEKLVSYINSTRNPIGTILPTVTTPPHKDAPSIPLFSGRGPTYKTTNILKPDIAAPGVGILAAWPGNNTEKGRTSHFRILSGTSMSCPHVTAIAALVKSQNPTWSPSAIKSAILTTAIQTNNKKKPITSTSGDPATPYDYGAGQVSLSGPLKPGLVYETGISDYLQFLCYKGYNLSTIKLISTSVSDKFSCPKNSNINLATNVNYPTISVSVNQLYDEKNVKLSRTLTNVAEVESVYKAILDVPKGLNVKVIPDRLRFTNSSKRISYVASFEITDQFEYSGGAFGSITWTNGKYKVRTQFAVGG